MSWHIEATEQFERDLSRYEKKHLDELLVVMANLEKYKVAIEAAPHPRLVQFGFLHNEPDGIKAIDQSGGAIPGTKRPRKLQQTRLYLYADLESRTIHLFCIGDKSLQSRDIQFSKEALASLRKRGVISP